MRNRERPESIGVSNLAEIVSRCGDLTANRSVSLNGQGIDQLRFSADNRELCAFWLCEGRSEEVSAPLFDDPDPMIIWGDQSITLRCWCEMAGQYVDWRFAWVE